jgi:hypothetical protein
MGKNRGCVRIRFSRIVWFILAILLCASPCGAQFVDVGETADIDYAIENDFLTVFGTANLYPGAYVDFGILAFSGCTINIYGGEIGDGFYIMLFSGEPSPVVTVYGKDFALDGTPIEPWATQFSVDPYAGSILTGTYENGDPVYLWFLSDVPIYLEILAPEVTIDIKPNSDQNTINLKSRGVVPVALLTTDDFDAATVDPATALFAGAAPVKWKLTDVDDDGDADMLFHFKTQELNLDENSVEATLTVQLMSETSEDPIVVSGSDDVRIVPAKKLMKKQMHFGRKRSIRHCKVRR